MFRGREESWGVMLSALQLKPSYRSNRDNLLLDFYIPCLHEATHYCRAVGYFTSSVLSLAARGLRSFIDNRGQMRLVASPYFNSEDVEAIKQGYKRRDVVIGEALQRGLAFGVDSEVVRDRLGFLAWMIGEGMLDIKIAVLEEGESVGLYHEKIGIFEDRSGNRVAFTGSANESAGGLLSNFESLQVFRSWVNSDSDRISPLLGDFDDLWNNRTRSLGVYEFPEAVRRELLKFRPTSLPAADPEEEPNTIDLPLGSRNLGYPKAPKDLEIRDYQREAVEKWFAANGRGLLRMATGTGKTLTALALVTQLYRALQKENRRLVTVVVCPFKHLVSQWGEEAAKFNILPIKCMESRQAWIGQFTESLAAVRDGHFPFLLAITTISTFQGEAFQDALQRIRGDFLLVADEVHNMGSTNLRQCLPENAAFRLGLSATPERWFDEAGTQSLLDYFGSVVYELGLAEAISIGALTKYDYFPHLVEFTPEELSDYLDISAQIARLSAIGSSDSDGDMADDRVKILLIKRGALIGMARNKLPALVEVLTPFRDSTHNLVYCGSGNVEISDDESMRQVDAVVGLLGNDLRMRVNSYTAETYLEERDELRKQFADGDLQALVAIRCLDEGVDIPETRRAFILASSTNPKQFIQRRGRILRRAKGKTLAEIHDFLVTPPADSISGDLFSVERKLLRRELLRVIEFAKLAANGPQAMDSLLPLRSRFNLLDVG
jgi:DNA phosphorothioation system restriction enzyme